MRRFWPLVLLFVIAFGAVAVSALVPRPKRYDAVPGRPLLVQDGSLFSDSQVGLRFMPPPEWGMQVRSTEASRHRPERLLVKYKRVLPDMAVAWLRVRVMDVPSEQSAAEYLKGRKPPEINFSPAGEIEEPLTVANHPAAKRTYTGSFDVDGRGMKPFRCEVAAIKRENRIFEFAGTFAENDEKAKEQLKSTLESVTFE